MFGWLSVLRIWISLFSAFYVSSELFLVPSPALHILWLFILASCPATSSKVKRFEFLPCKLSFKTSWAFLYWVEWSGYFCFWALPAASAFICSELCEVTLSVYFNTFVSNFELTAFEWGMDPGMEMGTLCFVAVDSRPELDELWIKFSMATFFKARSFASALRLTRRTSPYVPLPIFLILSYLFIWIKMIKNIFH